jgi:hypothetical protein
MAHLIRKIPQYSRFPAVMPQSTPSLLCDDRDDEAAMSTFFLYLAGFQGTARKLLRQPLAKVFHLILKDPYNHLCGHTVATVRSLIIYPGIKERFLYPKPSQIFPGDATYSFKEDDNIQCSEGTNIALTTRTNFFLWTGWYWPHTCK